MEYHFLCSSINPKNLSNRKIEVNGPGTHEVYRYLRLNSELKTGNGEAK